MAGVQDGRPSAFLPAPQPGAFGGSTGVKGSASPTSSPVRCSPAAALRVRLPGVPLTPAPPLSWTTHRGEIWSQSGGGHCTLSTTTGNGLLPPGEGGGSGVSPRGVSGRSPEHVVQVSQGVAEGGSRGNRWTGKNGAAGFVRTARDLSATSCRSAVRGRCGFSDGGEAHRRPEAHGVGNQPVSAPLHGFGTFAVQYLDNSTGQPGDGKRTAKGRKKASAG